MTGFLPGKLRRRRDDITQREGEEKYARSALMQGGGNFTAVGEGGKRGDTGRESAWSRL